MRGSLSTAGLLLVTIINTVWLATAAPMLSAAHTLERRGYWPYERKHKCNYKACIIGVSVGCASFVLILVGLLVLHWRRVSKRSRETRQELRELFRQRAEMEADAAAATPKDTTTPVGYLLAPDNKQSTPNSAAQPPANSVANPDAK